MSSYVCTACGHESLKWFGRCPSCGDWSSAAQSVPDGEDPAEIVSLHTLGDAPARLLTGMTEVDRVLGGGFVLGEVVLLAGEPGVGKSTLVLQIVDGIAQSKAGSIVFSGEESAHQVALRAARLGIAADGLQFSTSNSLQAILTACRAEQPDLVVIDSIQTVTNRNLDQAAGSVVQVRECASALIDHAKASGSTVLLTGHVTKEGSVAGPKVLEHLVDAVLSLEGERTGSMRLLRAQKNRFGSCDELGVFSMGERGLSKLEDPSALLLDDRAPGTSGSIVFPSMDGSRPLLIELQALVEKSALPQPRRVAIGVDQRRLTLVLGVLTKHLQLRLGEADVFMAAAGGLSVREPASDLASCIGLASAYRDWIVDERTVAFGEVGLGGEVRRVPGAMRRLEEARRLGFDRAIAPRGAPSCEGIEVVRVSHVEQALSVASRRHVSQPI
jgi:DNA repair protein RadA/Sms